jgi:hypothetical protein
VWRHRTWSCSLSITHIQLVANHPCVVHTTLTYISGTMHQKPLLHDVLRSQGLDQLTNKLQKATLSRTTPNDSDDSDEELVAVVSMKKKGSFISTDVYLHSIPSQRLRWGLELRVELHLLQELLPDPYLVLSILAVRKRHHPTLCVHFPLRLANVYFGYSLSTTSRDAPEYAKSGVEVKL